ncbi:MAG: tetratricopeptide repeat protein [Cyclobacteriaceae bacterium]
MKILIIGIALLIPQFSFCQNSLTQSKEEVVFNSGLALLSHGEYGAARQRFTDYLNLNSGNELKRKDAAYYKAFCALNLYHADGEKQIEDFVQDNPNHPRGATAYYDLGNFFYNEKNYGRASAYYNKVDFTSIGYDQQSIGRFHWGYSLFNLRKLEEALEQFNFIKALGGQYGPASSYYAGFIELSNGDYQNAVIDFDRAGQNNAYARIVPHLKANALYKQGRYDDLLAYAKTLEGKEDLANKEEIALYVAEAQFKKGDYEEAAKGYAVYIDSQNGRADRGVMLRAGYAAYSLGDDDSALTLFKESASDKDSVGFYASYYLGSIYLKQDQKPLALVAFDNAKKFKDDAKIVEESSFQHAKILYDLGRPDEAIEHLEGFLEKYPNSTHSVEVREVLSQAYVNANNFNKAIAYIEALPRRGPAVNRAYQKATLLKGMELFNMENYPEAVQYFEKSIATPEDQGFLAEASFWNGEAYSIGRKYEEASDNYLRVIGLSGYEDKSLLSKTRYGLGYAYFNLQQYDRALFNFKEFVNKGSGNPNYADGLLRLADCYYVTKSYAEALSNYRRLLQMSSPDKDYAHLQAGVIMGIQRKYPEAAAELDQVLRNYPQSRFIDEAMFQRAQLDFEQGKYAASVAGFSLLINSNKGSKFVPYAYMRRAASNYNLKDFNKTAEDYITIVEEYPSHPVANDALLPLQEALNLAGRTSEFESHISSFKSANPDAKGIESVEFESAKNLYFNQDYQRAIQSLTNYLNNYPESPKQTEANYYKAEAYYRLRDYENALKIHRSIENDVTFSFSNRVVARIAELTYKLGQFEKAVASNKKLERMAATKKEQYNAWSGLMETYFILASYDSADFYARQILNEGSVSAGAENRASLFLGKSAMARGDYETAKDEFLNTLNSARDESGAEAKYLLGEIFYLSKEYKQCYETLVSLNTDFAAYTEWVGKSYLLLSDNFVAMGDLFQAKGTLKSLENFPLERVKLLAAEKLKKIEADEKLKEEELKSDTTLNQGNE